MNERTKRVNLAYRWLIWLGEVDDKLSFAQRLGKERANITNILNGKGDASDRFCGLILSSFPGIFSRDWLLDGVGEMLATASGVPTCQQSMPATKSVESDTPEQRQSIIDMYAGLIKESESFRREIKIELAEVRTLRSELQQARDDFRDATYRMTQFMRNMSESHQSQSRFGIAAEDINEPKNP